MMARGKRTEQVSGNRGVVESLSKQANVPYPYSQTTYYCVKKDDRSNQLLECDAQKYTYRVAADS